LVLEAAEQLDAELRRLHHGLRDVAAWPRSSGQEVANMRAALRRAFGTVRAICEYVIECSEVETSGMRASALRARGVVLAIELSELKRMECGATGSGWPSHRFADVEMFREYLLGEVGRINSRWIASQKQAIANELEIVEGGETAYVALGCDPDVAEVLAWGWSVAPQAMRRPWRIIASLLGVVCSRQAVTAVELPALTRRLATQPTAVQPNAAGGNEGSR
jgi:hypothetical protein